MTSNEELFSCIFCKESFNIKEELQVHFRKHGDPKFNQSVKNRVSNDSDGCGDKSADVDLVSCDVCSDTFPSISKAITHKHKVHPDHDAKYFCPWCGKLFTMKHLYNKHVETSHDSKVQYDSIGFHCDYCQADFFTPSAMVYHNKFFHRQDTELAAIGQSRKLKLFDQEMLPLYYCPFCGEEYFNKVNLHKHMGDDHSDENQGPDDVLRCPLCEAIFYHLDAYELHLTFHSIEDMYSEENEIVKNITEFSLEAVPPIMEKVENETTADSETTTNSMGIGEFLQLGMDETAGSESGEKRKKKKKHKKSKKSAITLDEFFNMNKDVFGEGIDVEGIEEVPTRVVAKRLKTRPQRPKPPPKVVSSDIEKLKKQGIVVKKKLGNIPKFHSSLKGKPSGRPLNVAQNRLVKKVTTVTTKSNSTNDVLSKLLNQSNSQLKIVKKPLVQAPNSDLSEQSTAVEDSTRQNEEVSAEKKNNECDISKFNEHKNEILVNNVNGEVKTANDTTKKSNVNQHSPIPQKANDKILEKDKEIENKHENIELDDEINKQDEEESFCKNETSENRVKDLDENEASEFNLNERHGNHQVNKLQNNENSTTKPLNSLKKLSNLTVKSLNQQRVSKISSLGSKVPNTYEASELKKLYSINKELSQKPKEDKNMEAFKLLSKNITITSSNKLVQEDKLCSDQDPIVDKIEKLKLDHSVYTEAQTNKPKDDKNLEALKLLSKNITVKSSIQTVQENNDKNQDRNEKFKTEEFCNKQELPQKSKDDKNMEALKHLNECITIKSPNQPVKVNKCVNNDIETFKTEEFCNKQELPQKSKDDKNMEALKHLNKCITIKSPNQPVKVNKCVNNDIDEESFVTEGHNKTVTKRDSFIDKIHSDIQTAVKYHKCDLPVIKNASTNSPNINKVLLIKEEPSELAVKQQLIKTQNCDKILKLLPNITAKPVSKTHQQTATVVSKSSNTILSKDGTCVKSASKIEERNEIETFNIDDSDDEDEKIRSSTNTNNTSMKISKTYSPNSSTHHIKKLKNLGQQVTIKTTSQYNPSKNSLHVDDYENSDDDWDEFSQDTHNEGVSKDCYQAIKPDCRDQKRLVLQNKLKNLGQHITVKSRNPSPAQIKIQQYNDHDSDTEIIPTKVKISELSDDVNDAQFNECQDEQPSNCIVESPHEYSENEESDINNEQDIESLLKSNALRKPIQKINSSPLSNLHNISKDITIKSMRNKNNTEDEVEISPNRNSIENSYKQQFLKNQPNFPSQHTDRSNYQLAKSSDLDHNTANTEVIIKKFGTKTVIEEITTTVTKTIRTVNETVQQEVTNSSTNMTPSKKSQKIQNIIPRQQVYEGKQVRHLTPTIGTRVRNVTPQVRPSTRPTNQIVSVRPGLNIRPSNQKMAVANKPTSTTTSNAKQPVIGKPLKISPIVFSASNKRPTTENLDGPFSCFKKQKESLIPIGDLPEISQGDTSVLYTSSEMSKSHVSTRVITGNSMMTSSQVKSESCASSEQFTKLANMSGLKVVKTSSAHHVSKVEECKLSKSNQHAMKIDECKISSSNRTALEAIEKLRKQGLLIKKPRLDENYSEHSNSDDNYE